MKQNEETKALQEEIRTLKAEKKELACRLSGLSSVSYTHLTLPTT